jgi:two-component system LytT family response regulator
MTALVAALDPEVFVRISRSTAIRLDAIRELRARGHGDYDLLLGSGVRVRWSRHYRGPHAWSRELRDGAAAVAPERQ